MCRLFGFRALAPSQAHRSLIVEANALREQSREHPDGWGLAYYEAGRPTVTRSVEGAFADEQFAQLSAFVSSETVVAHVRKASVGALCLRNTHPFVRGRWTMAHNGTVPHFADVREAIEERLSSRQRALIEGDTDSERLFGLILTELEKAADPEDPAVSVHAVQHAIEGAVRQVRDVCRALDLEPSMNVVVTNGRLMTAFRHGRTLFYSTQYLPLFGCPTLQVPHFVVSSERIGGADAWLEVGEDELIGVDHEMRLVRRTVAWEPEPRLKKLA